MLNLLKFKKSNCNQSYGYGKIKIKNKILRKSCDWIDICRVWRKHPGSIVLHKTIKMSFALPYSQMTGVSLLHLEIREIE